MKCYELAQDLKKMDDKAIMLLIVMMLNFEDQDITEMKEKYGEVNIDTFKKYL